jgi:hypothetical protein
MKEILVYRHRRLDTNEIFYIGIGSEKRAKDKTRRTSFWKNIVSKTKYEVEIIHNNLSWEEACEKEISLIKEYGRRDKGLGTLVNMTDGGEGSTGNIRSEETRMKISNSMKGIKKSSQACINMSIAQKKSVKDPEKGRYKKIINIDTNEIFCSIKEAAESINKNRKSFDWRLKNSKNFNFKYYE